jgi:hypothetical protein
MRFYLWIALVLLAGTWTTPGQPAAFSPLTGSTSLTITLSSELLYFGIQPVGTTSEAQPLELTNETATPLTLGAIAATDDFSVPTVPMTNCPNPIPSHTSCYMHVVFKPTATGLRTAVLTINELSPGSAQTVKLEGNGTGALVSPADLAWGTAQAGTTSIPKQVMVSNVGGAAMSLSTPTITNASGGDLWKVVPSNTNGCGPSLAASASCSYSVTFTPGGVDGRHAVLHINDNWGSHSVALSGMGTLVKFSTGELSFGNVAIGKTLSKTFTITNTSSTLTLNFTARQALAGADLGDFSVSGCTASLAPGASCTETATFTSSVTGDRDALVWIYDNRGPSPQYVYLAGVGVKGTAPAYQLIVSASPPSGGTVSPTSSLSYAPGVVVSVTATPSAGYFFTGWTGPGASALVDPSSATTAITMNAAESVTANFLEIPSYVVTLNSDDAGGVASNCQARGPSAGSGTNCSLRDALAAAAATETGNIRFDGTVFNANKSTAQNTITLTSLDTLNIPSNTNDHRADGR